MDARYTDWLRRAVPSEATWRTKLSELRRIEGAYGDVDTLFDADELQSLIEELTYTSDDQRIGRQNPSKIQIDGDLRNNLASYKSAVMKYARFRQDIEVESARAETIDARINIDSPQLENQTTFSFERDLQSALRREIGQLEQGLVIVDGGTERSVPSGRIDILSKDSSGSWVVIELKAVKAQRDAAAQLLAYMGDIKQETGEHVRGILVAPSFDSKTISLARVVPSFRLVTYSFCFTFSDPNDGNSGGG